MKPGINYTLKAILTCLIFFFAWNNHLNAQANFKANLTHENNEVKFETEVSYMSMATMVSMHARNEEGRCNIHFLNVKDSLEPGTYDTNPEEGIRIAAVCFIENTDQSERIVSDSGTLTILEIADDKTLSGNFEMTLKGTNTGKMYKFEGEFDSPFEK